MIALALTLAAAAAPQAGDAMPDDIVVVAVRDTCTLRFADKAMSDAQFEARSAEWKAGKPVRLILRSDAEFPCVRKIAKKLFDKGVTRIEFADPNGKPAFPFEPDPNLPRYTATGAAPTTAGGAATGGWSEMRAQVRRGAPDGARTGRPRRRRCDCRGVPGRGAMKTVA